MTFLCQVRDLRYTSVATTSGPTANSALLAWRTRTSNFTTLTASGGPATFNVVQPNLTITKNASAVNAGAMSFTLTPKSQPAISITWTSKTYFGNVTPSTLSGKTVNVEGTQSGGVLTAKDEPSARSRATPSSSAAEPMSCRRTSSSSTTGSAAAK